MTSPRSVPARSWPRATAVSRSRRTMRSRWPRSSLRDACPPTYSGLSARGDSMFRRLHEEGAAVNLTIDGVAVSAREGDSVAAALLAAGRSHCRTTPVSGAPRAPYCMMGVCFDCLVTIDGVGNRQGCMVAVSEGMAIETQHGKRELGK